MPPLSVRPLFPSPLFATLADHRQPTENPAALSPFPATLARHVNHNPFVCRSCEKHGGAHPSSQSLRVSETPSTNPLTIRHSPLSAISFKIRTSTNHASNPCRMRSSKTQHLRSFRIRTYKKTGGEGHVLTFLYPLKPGPSQAHLYLCTCTKGPAAREPRY